MHYQPNFCQILVCRLSLAQTCTLTSWFRFFWSSDGIIQLGFDHHFKELRFFRGISHILLLGISFYNVAQKSLQIPQYSAKYEAFFCNTYTEVCKIILFVWIAALLGTEKNHRDFLFIALLFYPSSEDNVISRVKMSKNVGIMFFM